MPVLPTSLAVPLWTALPALALGAIALGADVRTRRIPNRLTLPAVGIGLVAHVLVGRQAGLADSLLGLVAAGALLLPGFLIGWTGGGDVKLAVAIGAWLGYPHGVLAALFSLMAGGLVAVIVAARQRLLQRSLMGAWAIGLWVVNHPTAAPPPATSGVRFAFAWASAIGLVAALMVPA